MKILLTHTHSKENKGDAAILSVLLSDVKRVFPKSNIVISTVDSIATIKHFEHTKMISSFIYEAYYTQNNKTLKLIKTLYVIFSTFIWLLHYKKTNKRLNLLLNKNLKYLMDQYTSSDLFIPIGGGYLRGNKSFTSTLTLIILLYTIYIPVLLNKPVILYSQSIGPFSNKFQNFIVKFVLSKVNKIIVRENISLIILSNIGIKKDLIIKSVDAGFLFNSKNSTHNLKLLEISSKNQQSSITIGITARKWLNKTSQEKYELEMARFSDYLVTEKNANIVFIPQVTADSHNNDDDRIISKKIIKKMLNKDNVSLINHKLNHYETKSIYSNLDYIIGTRFHSVIFSLTSNVPALAIEYEHKTSGIMNDLGLSEWVIKMEDVTSEKLIKTFYELTNRRKEYLAILNSNLPAYIKEAKQTIQYVKKAYYRHINSQN